MHALHLLRLRWVGLGLGHIGLLELLAVAGAIATCCCVLRLIRLSNSEFYFFWFLVLALVSFFSGALVGWARISDRQEERECI